MDPNVKEWRYGFSKAIASGVDTVDFDLIATGAGMTVSQTSGLLNIASGTTNNSETIIRSKLSFNGDLILRYGAQLSQRIANQQFFIELVDKVADGVAFSMTNATTLVATLPGFTAENIGQSMYLGAFAGLAGCVPGRYTISAVAGDQVTFTVAGFPSTGTGTLNAFGRNYHQVLYDGTTATNTKYDAQRNGYNSGFTTATISTTAAPGHIGVIAMINAAASYLDQVTTSATSSEITQRASRIQNVPSDDIKLFLQIRVVNGTGAASTTTFGLNFVSITRHDAPSVMLAGLLPFSQNFVLPVSVPAGLTANLGTGGTGATSLGKAEDAAHASGDTGVAVWGVRIPTTPAAQTSAAGDYGGVAVDQEGKTVVTPFAGDEVAWQGNPITLTSTTSAAVKAAAAAGIRNYITDVTMANTSATGVRVDLLDGATVIRSFWVPPTSTVTQSFSKALKGTAATAVNFQLSAAVTDVRCSANGYLGV